MNMVKGVVAATMAAAIGFAQPGFAQVVRSPLQEQIDPGAVSGLAGAIGTALVRLPSGASQADAEAAIVFAIDQSGQSTPVVLMSLSSVNRVGLSPVALAALDSIRSTRSRLAFRGTGSIAGGPSIGYAFGPSLTVTGGSSDYVR